jgi:WD40 repeat protein
VSVLECTSGLIRRFCIAAIGLLALSAASAAPVKPDGPPVLPMLRVETGMHTSLIRRILVDAPRNRLITASDDKTIRVWQLPEQRLISILRVPIDRGHEGQVFGIALSPDGKTLAAAGWTGWDWDGAASIYFFDVISGELVRRIGGLRDAVHALVWTPDGQHLAVGLQGRGGLDVIRLADGKVVASDTQYRDKLTDLAIDRSGRMAAASLDGMVRLYDAGFKLIGRRVIAGGDKPISVRFSPDDTQLAVSFVDKPAISIVSSRNLNPDFSPQLDAPLPNSIFSVAWSADGRYLYATGDLPGVARNPVFRWRNGGRGGIERIPAALGRITEIQTLPDQRMVFAAEDPGFGIIDQAAHLVAFEAPRILDFSGAHGRLLVSANGTAISYPMLRGDTRTRVFVVDRGIRNDPAHTPRPSDLAGPRLQAPGWRVEGWQNTFSPRINGKAPRLDDYEMAHSYALSPDGKSLLLGTEWALRLLDANAREKWQVKLASVARAVNISGNGRFAVAALSDGTVRWYRMRDGKEVFAYFQHLNDKDWIAWMPDGHYMSSVDGDKHVGWHINRGRDKAPDFFLSVQFDRILYRPDRVVAEFLAAAGSAGKAGKNTKSAGQQKTVKPAGSAYDIARLAEMAPTRLRLRPLGVESEGGQSRLNLEISGEKGARSTRDLAIFVNGIPVTPARERELAADESGDFVRSVRLPLFQRENEIRVEAFNGLSLGVAETYLALDEARPSQAPKGNLYLLAIGVNDFPAMPKDTALLFAARDAEEITRALSRAGAGHYRKIQTHLVNDNTAEKPTKAVILQALRFVEQAEAADTVVIFLASHGISDAAGNYYFVPRDAQPDDMDRLEKGGEIRSLIPWTAFFDVYRRTAGRRLLIVDTCQARNIEGRFESHSLMKRSSASLFSLMLASKGDEESQEHPDAGHGLFTYALLKALGGDSDIDRDGYLSQTELFSAAVDTVNRLVSKEVGPQTPQFVSPPPLRDHPVVRAGRFSLQN